MKITFYFCERLPLFLGGMAILPLLEKPANYVLNLIDIGKGRRTAVAKYDPFIEQALGNIMALSQNASWAMQEMKKLNSKGCD